MHSQPVGIVQGFIIIPGHVTLSEENIGKIMSKVPGPHRHRILKAPKCYPSQVRKAKQATQQLWKHCQMYRCIMEILHLALKHQVLAIDKDGIQDQAELYSALAGAGSWVLEWTGQMCSNTDRGQGFQTRWGNDLICSCKSCSHPTSSPRQNIADNVRVFTHYALI